SCPTRRSSDLILSIPHRNLKVRATTSAGRRRAADGDAGWRLDRPSGSGGAARVLLQQLITFCTVVDEGGFTRAADVLSMSQPAVSKQVKTLEQKLQAELLVRTGRQVSLTPDRKSTRLNSSHVKISYAV